MNYFFRIAVVVSGVCLACACSRVSYHVTGTWDGGAGNKIYLSKFLEEGNLQAIDSAVVGSDFTFTLKGGIDEIQKMVLVYGDGKKKEIIVDGEPIKMTFKASESEKNGKKRSFLNVECEGGVEQTWFDKGKDLNTLISLMQLGKMITASKVDYSDQAAVDSVSRAIQLIDSSLSVTVKNYMDSTRNYYASTYFFDSYLMNNCSYEEVQGYYNDLGGRVKQSAPGMDLKKRIDEMGMVSVGGIAPNFKAKTPDERELSLYDLRGHVVLLDFWASWCGPCMAEMPNVKEIYEKYHDKGLEILGVSLDSDKEPWMKTIKDKELNWNHVSSLKKFDCPIAKRFKVTGIPRMYIIDKDGKIIAQDLRGEDLAKKIDELFAR